LPWVVSVDFILRLSNPERKYPSRRAALD
jgi:hypothetical protein